MSKKTPSVFKDTNNQKLYNTDYVLYDRANDNVLKFENSGRIVIFGNKQDAINDCRGNEEVVSCVDLPMHWQQAILSELNS